MKVFDCLIYNGEADLLEWRLRELAGVVDHWVIVEATRTFSGKSKALTFDASDPRWRPWRNRIRFVVCETLPAYAVGTGRMYETEAIQRDMIADGYTAAADTDLVMISDADEIPRAGAVRDYVNGYARALQSSPRPSWVATFLQHCHYYFLDLRLLTFDPWRGTRIASAFVARQLGGNRLRLYDGREIARGGWHFSFFGGADTARVKLAAWSHVEFDRPPWNEPGHFERVMAAGADWDTTRITETAWTPLRPGAAPAAVLRNIDRWRRYVGKPEWLAPGVLLDPGSVSDLDVQ